MILKYSKLVERLRVCVRRVFFIKTRENMLFSYRSFNIAPNFCLNK